MTDIAQHKIAQFVDKHDLGEEQFKVLVEEVGEVAEAYHRDAPDEEIAEELADVIYVARALAEMRDINISRVLNEVAEENLHKDISTDGDKVTKDGLDTPEFEGEKVTKGN